MKKFLVQYQAIMQKQTINTNEQLRKHEINHIIHAKTTYSNNKHTSNTNRESRKILTFFYTYIQYYTYIYTYLVLYIIHKLYNVMTSRILKPTFYFYILYMPLPWQWLWDNNFRAGIIVSKKIWLSGHIQSYGCSYIWSYDCSHIWLVSL